ncbi:MAG: hypothetical protein Q4G71_11535 [Pseudomonadota bacterium]|nr:hypothetical protein [Pseudomonadota bacterium]
MPLICWAAVTFWMGYVALDALNKGCLPMRGRVSGYCFDTEPGEFVLFFLIQVVIFLTCLGILVFALFTRSKAHTKPPRQR